MLTHLSIIVYKMDELNKSVVNYKVYLFDKFFNSADIIIATYQTPAKY